MMKLGYLGPKGTFSQEAAEKYIINNNDYELRDYDSMVDTMNALYEGEVDEVILPIENSIEGQVNTTIDMLSFNENKVNIIAEIVINVKQNLLAIKGGSMEKIEHILSHPQPIGQCINFINENFPKVNIKYLYSTTQAAEEVFNRNDPAYAAIASEVAAKAYNLEIIKRDVADRNSNYTRFVIISKNKAAKTDKNKTSIVFSTLDKPGSLYQILAIFNLWDINMTKIVSRPAKKELGDYIFFVDILGHIDDADIKDALVMIERKTSFLRILGSYPVYDNNNYK